jgi:formylglycine-generating enzyme required for sulfatase activity
MSQVSANVLKFYCPTHQVRFQAAGGEVISCEQGGHTIGYGFPASSWWEYCCDCETFWPSDPGNEILRRTDCLVCDRRIAKRYLCSACQIVSHESALLVRRKIYSIDSNTGIKPTCPGCAQRSVKIVEHSCSEAATNLLTSRSVCPFCDGQIAAQTPARTTVSSDRQPKPLNAFCPFCGTEQKPHNKFCKRCGKAQPKSLGAKRRDEGVQGQLALAAAAESKAREEARLRAETRRQEEKQRRLQAEAFQRAEKERLDEKRRRDLEEQRRISQQLQRDEDERQHLKAEADRRAEQERLRIEVSRPESALNAGDKGNSQRQAEKQRNPAATEPDQASSQSQAETRAPAENGASVSEVEDSKTEHSLDLAPRDAGESASASPDTDDSSNGPTYAHGWEYAGPVTPQKRRTRWIVAGAVAIVCLSAVIAIAIFSAASKSNENPRLAPVVSLPVPPAGMVYIPGGEFLMGNSAGDDFEKPAHKISVKPFYMDVHEVTCEEYLKFVSSAALGPSRPGINRDASPKPAQSAAINGICTAGATQTPATGMDWNSASAYARWAKKRLPTEEEWEFAARGTNSRSYPWGNEWKTNAANVGSANNNVVDVGSYPDGTSSAGVMDLIGNAWEWTSSDLTAYPNGHLPALPHGEFKVIRGGSWKEARTQATSTYRGFLLSSGEKDYSATGIRCVQDLTPQP